MRGFGAVIDDRAAGAVGADRRRFTIRRLERKRIRFGVINAHVSRDLRFMAHLRVTVAAGEHAAGSQIRARVVDRIGLRRQIYLRLLGKDIVFDREQRLRGVSHRRVVAGKTASDGRAVGLDACVQLKRSTVVVQQRARSRRDVDPVDLEFTVAQRQRRRAGHFGPGLQHPNVDGRRISFIGFGIELGSVVGVDKQLFTVGLHVRHIHGHIARVDDARACGHAA